MASRAEIDWSGPVVATPMGVVPAGAGSTSVQGIDVGIVGSLPLAAALLTGGPTPLLPAVQLLRSCCCAPARSRWWSVGAAGPLDGDHRGPGGQAPRPAARSASAPRRRVRGRRTTPR